MGDAEWYGDRSPAWWAAWKELTRGGGSDVSAKEKLVDLVEGEEDESRGGMEGEFALPAAVEPTWGMTLLHQAAAAGYVLRRCSQRY